MIHAELYPLINRTFEFVNNGRKKLTHVLVGEVDPQGHIKVLIETKEPDGELHREWIDYEFFRTYLGRAVA